MHVALEGVMYFMPFNADGTLREKGDLEKCMRWAELLKDYASSLAPYESPKFRSCKLLKWWALPTIYPIGDVVGMRRMPPRPRCFRRPAGAR